MLSRLIRINKSEPKIVKFDEPLKAVGVSIKTGPKMSYQDALSLGNKYNKIKRFIKNKKEPWAFIAVTKNLSSDKTKLEYFMGDVVTSFDNIPKDYAKFEIPAKTYAVFTISPMFNFLWAHTIGLTKKYIYSEWLPKSKYEADTGDIEEFEYHDKRSRTKKPSIDLYVAIREK